MSTTRYERIPHWLAKRKPSANAFLVYFWFKQHADRKTGWTYVSNPTIAKECGLSLSSVVRAKRELIKLGALKSHQRQRTSCRTLVIHDDPETSLVTQQDLQRSPVTLQEDLERSDERFEKSDPNLERSNHDLEKSPMTRDLYPVDLYPVEPNPVELGNDEVDFGSDKPSKEPATSEPPLLKLGVVPDPERLAWFGDAYPWAANVDEARMIADTLTFLHQVSLVPGNDPAAIEELLRDVQFFPHAGIEFLHEYLDEHPDIRTGLYSEQVA